MNTRAQKQMEGPSHPRPGSSGQPGAVLKSPQGLISALHSSKTPPREGAGMLGLPHRALGLSLKIYSWAETAHAQSGKNKTIQEVESRNPPGSAVWTRQALGWARLRPGHETPVFPEPAPGRCRIRTGRKAACLRNASSQFHINGSQCARCSEISDFPSTMVPEIVRYYQPACNINVLNHCVLFRCVYHSSHSQSLRTAFYSFLSVCFFSFPLCFRNKILRASSCILPLTL